MVGMHIGEGGGAARDVRDRQGHVDGGVVVGGEPDVIPCGDAA